MKAVIFDLDGVVVNTAHYHFLAWKKLASELKIHYTEADNERQKGVSRMESLEILLEIGNRTELTYEEKLKLAEKKNGYYLELIQSLSKNEILPGIEEFLKKLKKEKFAIALGSASKSGKMIIEKMGLGEYFDAVVDGTMVSEPKPDPEVFLKAAKKLNCDPSDCIVIEDSAAGIEAARRGKMSCIGIGNSILLQQADIVVERTQQLLELNMKEIINENCAGTGFF